MKTDLKDVTFIILIRLDSIQRLENIIIVTNYILKFFDTTIYVLDASDYNNGILKSVLNSKITYEYVKDKDPVLHKTRYYNYMTSKVTTPLLAIWDADIIVNKKYIVDIVTQLRNNDIDMAYPYNGICLNVPDIVRELFLKKKNISVLEKNEGKMDQLHNKVLYGGALIVNKDKYIEAGMENEKHYGWGNEDFDRYYRWKNLGYRIYRTKNNLHHLSHPKGINSTFYSTIQQSISSNELAKNIDSSPQEILSRINKNERQ